MTSQSPSWNRPLSLYFWLVSGVFLFTLIDNVIERPDGIIIASCFIAGVIVVSSVSRLAACHGAARR